MYLEIAAVGIITILFILFIYIENSNVKHVTVELGDKRLKAELADTMIKKSKGLMGRDEIGADAMLFTGPISGIWMKNMKFPIDIVWTNSTHVVDIARDVPPCKSLNCTIYKPKSKADYVIELPANWTEENKIKIGTKVKLPNNV